MGKLTTLLMTTGIMAAVLCQVKAQEGAPRWRIDVDGGGISLDCNGGSPGVDERLADWRAVDKDKLLVATGAVTQDWQKFSFSFIPKSSGDLRLDIAASHYKDDGGGGKIYYFVYYDDFSIEGSTLENGAFESMENNKLSSWKFIFWGVETVNLLVKDSKIAHTGNNCVRATHNKRVTQKIKAEAGKPVTVTFYAKAGSPLQFE